MTTMFVQLRRVVYLLVLMCFLSREAQVIYGQKTAKCPEPREEELELAERIMDRTWNGPGIEGVRSAQEMLAGGRACLEMWGREERECNENYAFMEAAWNATTEIVRTINDSLKGKWAKDTASCETEAVRKFVGGFDQMKAKYNKAADAVDELVKNVSRTQRECLTYVANLRDPANKLNVTLESYKAMVLNDTDYRNCDLEKRNETVVDYTARSREMERVLGELHNLSGKTHACKLQSEGGVKLLLEKKYGEFRELCPSKAVRPDQTTFTKVKNEVVKGKGSGDTGPTNKDEAREAEERQKDIKAFNETLLPLVKKHIKEVEQVEIKIKADAEERKARRAREKQEAEERARRAEEERKRKAEEAKRAAEEEKKRKAEEQKAMQAAQKAKEEEAKRVAAEKAKQAKEEAKRAAEKAKNKKDGGSSPALVHSSLILLVLSVLGCTLVC
ncbi:uncharacterized protein TM35_000044240 [Trypanosoma theileri]|uniref:Uncharacterized protein n=1 Tax=Trypanosoma theileri TaxID=67003 RepID=A0A1X0P700_9TRYP|nr:uncharacterized protein TM35_000044240 [Trypanosoma theileri]ORC92210.1 hypothetical protein TM35_000044240 [Trypanosoma theileri]